MLSRITVHSSYHLCKLLISYVSSLRPARRAGRRSKPGAGMSRFRSCQIQEAVGHRDRVRCRRAIGAPGGSKNWRAPEDAVPLAYIAELELPNKFAAYSLRQRGRSCVSAHLDLLASRTEKLPFIGESLQPQSLTHCQGSVIPVKRSSIRPWACRQRPRRPVSRQF